MRRAYWVVVATGVFAGMASAGAGGSPFCIRGCDFGAGDCSFSSYQQCQATASGREAYCTENPDFNPKAELQPNHRRLSRRRS
jgi:hypothetical protein